MIEKEVEVKIIGYNLEELKIIIEKSGAVFVKKEIQTNYLYNTAQLDENSYLRLRVTNDYSEFTLKTRINNDEVKINKEVTTKIDDYQSFLEIMECMGFKPIPQNKIRYKYILEEFVFDLDIWDKDIYPYPYLEIEAPSKDELINIIKKLDIPDSHVTIKSIKELINEL